MHCKLTHSLRQLGAVAAALLCSHVMAEPALDLGDAPGTSVPAVVATPAPVMPAAVSAPKAPTVRTSARPVKRAPVATAAASAGDDRDIERAVLDRRPVRVALAVGRERMVTFPHPVALHLPPTADGVLKTQVIERTVYLTALSGVENLRIVAEDLQSGRMMPLDLRAQANLAVAGELELFEHSAASSDANPNAGDEEDGPRPLDEVELTRYAAQMTYAPRRLMPTVAGVRSVPVTRVPMDGLLRGARVSAQPLGQWRSGDLYVTAVRVTNLEHAPLDIDLRELRGAWRAATAQQRRLLAAGSAWDTTALYLVCDRPFEACR